MGEFNEYAKGWIRKETYKEKMARARKILSVLNQTYPASRTSLVYKTPMQMLAAVILSAQATDKKVNEITGRHLFKKYRTPAGFAAAKPKTFAKAISQIGLYRAKTRYILAAAKIIQTKFKGKIPKTMAEILMLPGVARKTANIVLWNVHGIIAGIAVDTHVQRVSQRLGLTKHNDPKKIETDLMQLFPNKKEWPKINTLMIDHGRAVCVASAPRCTLCPLKKICPSAWI